MAYNKQDPETTSGTPVQRYETRFYRLVDMCWSRLIWWWRYRYFCQTCGVPIMSVTPIYKGKIVLKLGIVSSHLILLTSWQVE